MLAVAQEDLTKKKKQEVEAKFAGIDRREDHFPTPSLKVKFKGL